MGLLGLTATGVCAMVGAGINVIPFGIQRTLPGIGPSVLPAFALAAVPVLLAGLAYAVLASAMPRAGGTYVYASRGLHPYLGFAASFSQWFALCVAIGVVSYVLVPFVRDIAVSVGWTGLAATLERGPVRLTLSWTVLWAAVAVNLGGIAFYERLVVPLMFLTFGLGGVVIVAGFWFDHADFIARVPEAAGSLAQSATTATPPLGTMASGAVVLFASYIGFDSIAQAGGEARHPSRDLPLAIALAIGSVAIFYLLFTAAVYHAVPWQYVAAEAQVRDVTAPGLLGFLLPQFLTVTIIAAAAIALLKDLPPMLLSVSRLMFAWAEDGIFPRAIAVVHPRFRTPHLAILASGGMASLAVLASHLAGDFFLGVDILVTAMLVNFLLMAVTVLTLPSRNPAIASRIRVFPDPRWRGLFAALGVVVLALCLGVHTWRDLTAPVAWYFRSTVLWLLVLTAASLVYLRETRALRRRGVDLAARFAELPAN